MKQQTRSHILFYTVLITIFLVAISGFVTSDGDDFGHDASSIMVDVPNDDGTFETMYLDDAIADHRIGYDVPVTDTKLPDKWYMVGDKSESSNYLCTTVTDIEEYCADEDGCIIRALMQHEKKSQNDQVRVHDWEIFIEQEDMSNENVDDIYAWAHYPGADRAYRMGKDKKTFLTFWSWAYAYNYMPSQCIDGNKDGPIYIDGNKYDLTFRSHPYVYTRIVLID